MVLKVLRVIDRQLHMGASARSRPASGNFCLKKCHSHGVGVQVRPRAQVSSHAGIVHARDICHGVQVAFGGEIGPVGVSGDRKKRTM
jgi:hypothetical protein